ncbi:MurR/RpiR family transcriptional regulator [Desemzia sp. RIT804]|uniref:MurR/RpiR family transcriptional regulator n=1 Tax=Desemzia sp. RIT 804 TaxID=2810209 RepID=UPI0019500A3B|nr:MurR/RpiR family transcriptional regulator [Desemzia sp. RIT 804]MBM6615285.1 MurR/RpiR family transcriptional regulator [Desemzia sp. RIT 804]
MSDFLSNVEIVALSDNDFKIYNYIQDNRALIPKLKLHELASRLFVSDTIIIRFCQKIGLSGFNELKYRIKNELLNNQKKQSSFREQIDQQIIDFQHFLNTISMTEIQQIIKLICSDRPLYIYGRSLSSVPAKYLYTVLNSLDRRCILIEDLHLIKNISRTVQPGAIILIMSASAPLDVYNSIFEASRKTQATSILISSNKSETIHQMADFYLFCDDKQVYYNETDVNSRIYMLTLVQIMIELASEQLLTSTSS